MAIDFNDKGHHYERSGVEHASFLRSEAFATRFDSLLRGQYKIPTTTVVDGLDLPPKRNWALLTTAIEESARKNIIGEELSTLSRFHWIPLPSHVFSKGKYTIGPIAGESEGRLQSSIQYKQEDIPIVRYRTNRYMQEEVQSVLHKTALLAALPDALIRNIEKMNLTDEVIVIGSQYMDGEQPNLVEPENAIILSLKRNSNLSLNMIEAETAGVRIPAEANSFDRIWFTIQDSINSAKKVYCVLSKI